MTRALALLLPCLAIGCFSPEVSTDEDSSTDGPGSSGTTTAGTDSPTPSGSTDTPGTGSSTDTATETATDSVGETDATGNGVDGPPVFESFTVNGSTTPADVAESSLVILLASVSDDEGLATVEFFDGDTLLGVATEEPYRLEVLVTSSNNGGHAYSASATDTSDQSADSNDVQLGVTIDGGVVLDTTSDLFAGEEAFGLFGGIAEVGRDRYVLAGSSDSDIDTPLSTALTFDNEANILNSATLPANRAAPPVRFDSNLALVPTVVVLDTVTHETGIDLITALRYEAFNTTAGAIEPAKALQFPGGNSIRGALATNLTEGFGLTTGVSTLSAYEPDLDSTVWEATWTEGTRTTAIQALADGSIAVGLESPDGCQGGAQYCLRKLNPDGTSAWTLEMQGAPFEGALAPDTSAGVFVGLHTEEDDLLVIRLDGDGIDQATEVFTFANPLSTLGVHLVSDGQGGVVAALGVGQANGSAEVPNEVGVVLRMNATLAELWRSNGFALGSRPVAMLRSTNGSLYVAGIEPTGVPSLLGTEGDVWLARANL